MYLKITAYNDRDEIIHTTVYDDLPAADLPAARLEAKRPRLWAGYTRPVPASSPHCSRRETW
jgi:hypothetical protein